MKQVSIKVKPLKKKRVKRTKALAQGFFRGTPAEVIEKIKNVEKEYGECRFRTRGSYDPVMIVEYESIETDKEFEARKKKEDKRIKSDMKRLKNLLEKYEVTDVNELG